MAAVGLTEFQKLLVLKIVRPNRLYAAMSSFVKKILGKAPSLFYYKVFEYVKRGQELWRGTGT